MLDKIKKIRHFGILLSFALMLGLMPGMSLTAYADGNVASVTVGETTTNYETLTDAVTAWNAASGATLTLLADVTMANTINVSGTKILDLNGYGIKKTGSGRVLMVTNGANMTLHDSNATRTDTGANRPDGVSGGYITGGNTRNESGSCVRVESGSAFNMYGGTITGNTLENGGGAVLVIGGNFNMYGGIITGNKSDNNCGGVWVHSKEGSTFNMYCGTITDNDNTLYDVNAEGVMTTSSNATIGDFDYSEYVAVTFDANGGTGSMPLQKVRKNTDTTIFANVNCSASGISDPAFSREGYDFAGWNTQADGEGTNYTAGTSTINISEATTLYAQWTALVASVTSGGTTTNYTNFASAVTAWNNAANGATLTLLTDVETSSTINVSGTKTLDLNGYGIRMTGSDRVIKIGSGTKLTLNDSDTTKIHYIQLENYRGTGVSDTGSESFSNGTGAIMITGGYITGGLRSSGEAYSDAGAGVYNEGTFVMNGGNIVGNTITNNNSGAGVRNQNNFTMNGGRISYNRAGKHGGGVTTHKDNGLSYSTSFKMTGGEISNNYAVTAAGGIQTAGGSVILEGGSIIDNTCAGSNGGGVYLSSDYLEISGNVSITGNKHNNNPENVYLATDKKIKITGSLTNTTPIGVTMQTPGVFTSSTDTSLNDASKFTSDNTSYAVVKNADNQLELVPGYIVTYKVVNGTWSDGTTADKTETVASGSTPASVPTGMKASEGYTDGAWDTDPAETTITEAKTFTYTFNAKTAQTIAAEDVNVTYGDTDKSVSASVTDPATGGGAISYAVKDGSGDYIDVDASSGSLTIKKVPTDGKAYVIVTAAETDTCIKATKEVAVTINKAEVTAPAIESKTYNTEKQTADVAESDLYSVTRNEGGTDVGEYDVVLTLTDAANYKWSDSMEAAKTLTLKITKRSVTMTSSTVSKAYDGKPLTEDTIKESGDGFADGEGAEYNVTGTQTLPGSSDNTFTYTLKEGTKADNYEITKTEGTLTVTDRTDEGSDEKYEITVEANSDSVKYDGTEHSVSGFRTLTFTENGVEYTVSGLSASAEGTDAGSYTVTVTGTPVVKDSDGNDLTDQFIVDTAEGTLTISKRDVTFTSATDTKEYDGKALTNSEVTVGLDGFAEGEGATFNVTGSQKLVGSSANSFTYTLNSGTKQENYNITTSEGTLTVTSREAVYEINPQANSCSAMYDGADHFAEGLVTDIFEVDGETYTVSGLDAYGSGRNAGEYTVNVTGTAVVTDAEGNDVSSEFSVIPQSGKLTIKKRSVTMTSASASKVYDGNPLTKDEIKVSGDGFADSEGAVFTVTGTRTLPGESDNTFTYELMEDTDAANYDISEPVYGKLTVTDREDDKYKIKVVAKSKDVKYNGSKQSVSGFEKLTFTVNSKNYTVEGLTAEASAKDAGTYPVKVTGKEIVKDSNGSDVTAEFTVIKVDGVLTISKANAACKKVPTAKKLIYNEKAQKLVTAGTPEGGEMQYSVDRKKYTEKIPTGTDAGEYTVYYRVKGDKNHKDSKETSIAVIIEKAEVVIAPPTAKTLRYNGNKQKLVTKGKAKGGVLEYSLDGEVFDEDVPEAVEEGKYTVYYRAIGDDNHEDSEVLNIPVLILPAENKNLSNKAFGDFSGKEEFVLGAGDENLTVSAKGCEGMNVQFELKASGGGYVLVTNMDNFGRNAEFDLSFDKEGGSVAADVTCEEYHSKYSN